MSRRSALVWSLVDRTLRLLDAEEREAVRGDLAESSDSAAQALRGVLGLVMHRQAMLWQHPRPWLILVLFVMPLGALLSLTASSHAGLSAIYLWLVVNNANLSLLRSAGFWYTLLQILPALLLPCLSLGCIAWMAGVLLVRTSRRTCWTSGALLCLVVLCSSAVSLSQPLHSPAFDANGPVHANAFYRSVFPLLFPVLCILSPALLGMRRAVRCPRLSPLLLSLFWVSILMSAASLFASVSTMWLLRIWALPPLFLAAFACMGPAAYLLTENHLLHQREQA